MVLCRRAAVLRAVGRRQTTEVWHSRRSGKRPHTVERLLDRRRRHQAQSSIRINEPQLEIPWFLRRQLLLLTPS